MIRDLLLAASLVGATLIVVRSTIFGPIRKVWPALLECSQCAGTWVGVVAGASGLVVVVGNRYADAVVVGCATSFLATLADALLVQLLGDPHDGGPP